MPEFINKIFAELSGFDFWFAAILFVIGLAGWYYFGRTKKPERETAKHQLWFAGLIALIGITGIGVHHLFFELDYTFSKDVAGILVLRIEGDDEKNSLQRDLVSTLNTELSKEALEQRIEVRAHTENVTEAMGLKQAHAKAREIGRDCKALLVIWGNRVGENKFHPRLTVVEDKPRIVIAGDRVLPVQNLNEVSLPTELVNQPIFLTHFAAGYIFYTRKDYNTALTHFEAALNRPIVNPIELSDIRYYAGTSHGLLWQGKKAMAWHLQRSIAYFDTVLGFYTEQNFPEKWAKAKRNWGNALWCIPTGDRTQNLQNAITAYEAVLRVYTERDFPEDWAMIQNNLGAAYYNLLTGNQNENLQKAIDAYEASLRIYTEKDFPKDWAMAQSNLGEAYRNLFIGDRNKNLQKAIAANQAALRVYTEKDFPEDWAITQINLGAAYADLPISNRGENLQKAIAAYEAALRVYAERDSSMYWAGIENNLGEVYVKLPVGNRIENLQKAVNYFEKALKIWTVTAFSDYHQIASQNLKDAQSQLQNLTKK